MLFPKAFIYTLSLGENTMEVRTVASSRLCVTNGFSVCYYWNILPVPKGGIVMLPSVTLCANILLMFSCFHVKLNGYGTMTFECMKYGVGTKS